MSVQIRQWAPIALFIFKRPAHTRRVIESLRLCTGFADSRVFVFADGPRSPEDVLGVEETRAEARRLLGDHAVFVEREINLGVDKSIVAGVSELCDRYGRVVVVEEDLILSPNFLHFLNSGLTQYDSETRLMQVCGYMFDVPELSESRDAIFLPMVNSSGWATWKRAWSQLDPDATGWRERLRDDRERRRFDLDGNYKYSSMLKHHMRQHVPAWDIRWYYSVFVQDGLVLFPPRTLVLHEYDGTGTHDRFALPAHQGQLEMGTMFEFPDRVMESPAKKYVFRAVGVYRPSSFMNKSIAMARFLGRRLRFSRVKSD
jgi:hypothetical protein